MKSFLLKLSRESMFSFVFPTLDSKRNRGQMTQHEVEKRAMSLLALLKVNEDKLVAEAKTLAKKNRADAHRIFTAPVGGWTLYHAAALRGCRKLVKIALKVGVNVNLRMGEPEGIPGGCSALHLAAHRGDVSIIDVLLSNGADVNQTDDVRKTPVFYASQAHNTLAVKTLKRAGADLSLIHDSEHSTSGSAPDDVKSAFRFLPFPGCSGTKTKR